MIIINIVDNLVFEYFNFMSRLKMKNGMKGVIYLSLIHI